MHPWSAASDRFSSLRVVNSGCPCPMIAEWFLCCGTALDLAIQFRVTELARLDPSRLYRGNVCTRRASTNVSMRLGPQLSADRIPRLAPRRLERCAPSWPLIGGLTSFAAQQIHPCFVPLKMRSFLQPTANKHRYTVVAFVTEDSEVARRFPHFPRLK